MQLCTAYEGAGCGERTLMPWHSNCRVVGTCTLRISDSTVHLDNFLAICERIPQFLQNQDQYIHSYGQLAIIMLILNIYLRVTNFRVARTSPVTSDNEKYV